MNNSMYESESSTGNKTKTYKMKSSTIKKVTSSVASKNNSLFDRKKNLTVQNTVHFLNTTLNGLPLRCCPCHLTLMIVSTGSGMS